MVERVIPLPFGRAPLESLGRKDLVYRMSQPRHCSTMARRRRSGRRSSRLISPTPLRRSPARAPSASIAARSPGGLPRRAPLPACRSAKPTSPNSRPSARRRSASTIAASPCSKHRPIRPGSRCCNRGRSPLADFRRIGSKHDQLAPIGQ